MEVRVDDWGVDACYSGTHKCRSIPSGGSPITFGERAMQKVGNREQKPFSYYFDIQELMRYWSGGIEKSYHPTAAISDRKSTSLNSNHSNNSYAVFFLNKKK